MAHHTPYPIGFPSECIGDLIQIARGGFDEIVARKAEVGLHSWNITGWGLSVTLGTPDGPFHTMAPEEEADLQERLEEFATEFAACCPDKVSAAALAEVKSPVASAAPGAPRKIDWKKWIKFFVEIILPLLITI